MALSGMTADSPFEEFSRLSTSTISDALDRLLIAGQVFGLLPIGKTSNIVGRAFTVGYVEAGQDGGAIGDFVEAVGPDEVIVIDNMGRLDATVWGDLLTTAASRRGIRGTVIDGVCRDADASAKLDYPIFARGRYMRTGKGRIDLASTRETITVGGASVSQGDLIVGDTDGVVAIPRAREAEVLAAAREIEAKEQFIREAVLRGETLATARERHGYFTLQTPASR